MQLEYVEQIFNKLGIAFTTAIEYYSMWYIISSLSWLLMSVSVWIIGYKVCKYVHHNIEKWVNGYDVIIYRNACWISYALLSIIFMVVATCQFPDLFAPQGKAIHELITDLKP